MCFPRLSSFHLVCVVRQAVYLTSFFLRSVTASRHHLLLQMDSSGQKLLTFSVTNSANLREFMLSFILVVPVGVMSVDTYSWRKENFGRGLNWIWLFVRDINPLNDWPYSRSPRAGEQSLNLSARCVCTRVLPHQC